MKQTTESMVLSQAVEDYIKSIYILETEGESGTGVSTTRIAEALQISSASVTNMVKKLDGLGLLRYESYRGVQLTETGRKIALEIVRHHRLLELYLKEVMGYSWDEVHAEAEKLEHHISEQFEERIAELLDHPTHDPHGDPIPSKDGVMPEMAHRSLAEVPPREEVILGRVTNQEPELLRYLETIGLLPGVGLEVLKKEPLEGPITLRVGEHQQVIAHSIARSLFVLATPDLPESESVT
ncbi:MAG: metal-dependent transcriptional regulator [Balneolaceae bacterium]